MYISGITGKQFIH